MPNAPRRHVRSGLVVTAGFLFRGVAAITVTEDTTADDLREAITHLAAEARRLPAHWVDKRASIHAHIDALLDELHERA